MPISDADVNAWFDTYLVNFMNNDVTGAITGRANFGAALMLLCYTEVLGGIATGTLGQSGNVKTNFNAGLALLDAAAFAENPGNGTDFYTAFPFKLNGKQGSLYEVFRCGLVHEYFGKGLPNVNSDPLSPTSPPGNGVRWFTHPASGQQQLLFEVNPYFKHFRSAVQTLRAAVLADKASTGARAFFEKSLTTLVNNTVTP